MDLGLFMTTQYPLDHPMEDVAEDLAAQAQLVEQGGFEGLYVGEHHATPSYNYLLNETVLPFIAARTESITVGTFMSLVPLHNPVRLAEFGATLDVLSGGRFRFGAAQGYRDKEYHVFDVDYEQAPTRFEESIPIIKSLWSGETLSHHGQHFQLEDVSIHPQPLQEPRPAIWTGASNEPAIRRAARITDGWMGAHVPLDQAADQVEIFRDERRRRDLERGTVGFLREAFLAPTPEEAERLVKEPLMKKYSGYTEWNQDKVIEGDEFSSAWEQLSEDRFLIGDPESVLRELEQHVKRVDLDQLILRVQFPGMDPESIHRCLRLLGEEVVPVVTDW